MVGLFSLLGRLPFVESIRANQTTSLAKSGSKRGFARNRFSARVDHLVTDLWLLGPKRNQAPLDSHELALAFRINAAYQHVLGWRNVKAWLRLDPVQFCVEYLGVDLCRCMICETTAHGDII